MTPPRPRRTIATCVFFVFVHPLAMRFRVNRQRSGASNHDGQLRNEQCAVLLFFDMSTRLMLQPGQGGV
jgi:hypothetical protein